MRRLTPILFMSSALLLPACKDDEEDHELGTKGESCTPSDHSAEEQEPVCEEGLACEPVGTSDDDYVCAARLEIRGMVFDAFSIAGIEGALVVALDETNAPVTDVAVTDADGHYALDVSARRDPDGEIAETLRWTLVASADTYHPFPGGVRPALPVNAADAQPAEETEEDAEIHSVIENTATDIALIPRDEDSGAAISGTVEGVNAPGTLVVAEGVGAPAPYAIADLSGAFTLFNVPAGEATVRGYRVDLEVEPASVSVGDEDVVDVVLALVSEEHGDLAVVSGDVNIVNADGNSQTSVVLVPSSVFNELLERGPVPFGLRDPAPPEAPTVDGAFEIGGVSSGTYKVLAAFENDDLVRDPDESIAGTAIQEVTLGVGQRAAIDENFKVTADIAVISPGAEIPQWVDTPPTFIWADDSSETHYGLLVFDALGNIVWEDAMVPGVSGSDTVEVPYGGPALEQGMYYQFRATSFKETPQGTEAISRTEDLRGVFVFGTEPTEDTDGG